MLPLYRLNPFSQLISSVMLGIFILFIISGVKSCSELKYSLSGEVTTANISRTYKSSDLTSPNEKHVNVTYHFDNAEGARCEGEDSVPLEDWIAPADKQVEIIFMPDTPEINKLTATRSMTFPIIFLSMLGLIIGWVVWISIQAKRGVFG